ncbi:urease accessory protein UreH domain-containing protein [Actinotalea solisilvae]|uniref:urease accessory protein UreH domain-containing protein n=1 Tax=Actinotalea solisilvae TaxID=2072922 RepID=UPI0018F1E373|nr:sulfite exporter TauE/SafE family protein [Actinotalea solisilvae]
MADIDLPVRGMTCRACEVRVRAALRRVPGVAEARVSSTRGRARVRTTGRVPRRLLVQAVAGAGYEVGEDTRAWLSRDSRVWADVAVAAVVLVGLVAVAHATGWTDPARLGGTLGTGGLLLVVGLGVTAGFSTCMALVGGIVLGVAARGAQQRPDAPLARRLRPHLLFGAGRVAGFAAGGALLGVLGSAVRLSGGAVALVTLVVSAAMVALGLQLTAVSPRLTTLVPALPAGLASRLGLDGDAPAGRRLGPDARAALLGATTFLLPCGITQVVQLYAVSTADPLRAALVMTAFACGTAPGLLGLAGLTAAARGALAPRVLRVAGVAVLAFAAVNVAGAVTVLAPGLVAPAAATAGAASAPLAPLEDGVQVVRTVQDGAGYAPAVATVRVGVPVRWEVDSVTPGCASALYAPDLGLSTVLLEPGVNVFEFTPQETGRLHYSCAMGMYRGVVDVVAAPAGVSGGPEA